MPTSTTTSLKLEPETRRRIQQLAAAQRRTPHWLMREAIEQYLQREEYIQKSRQEALTAWVNYQATGRHLTAEEADSWLARLEAGENVAAPECHT